MKKLAALIMFAALAAQAAPWINDSTGDRWPSRPQSIIYAGADWDNPSDDILTAAGARELTPAEIAAEASAEAVAVSNAAAQASLPQVFPNGIAVVDEEGHHVELVPEGQDVVAVQISNSPIDPETRRAMKQAAVAAERQRRQDWRTANLALRSSLKNNISDVDAIRDGLSSTSTAAQVRSALIATVRELRQAQGDLQELRRLLAGHVREDQ